MKYIISLLIICLLASPVNAWGPITHQAIGEQVITGIDDAEIYEILYRNQEEFLAGCNMPDITVFAYYESFEEYEYTHIWQIATTMIAGITTEADRAFTYGIISHLSSDTVSHSKLIPSKIIKHKVRNGQIHPIIEAQVDDRMDGDYKAHLEATLSQYNPRVMDNYYNALHKLDPTLTREVFDFRVAGYTNGTTLYSRTKWASQNSVMLADVSSGYEGYLTESIRATINNIQAFHYNDTAKVAEIIAGDPTGKIIQDEADAKVDRMEESWMENNFGWIYELLIKFGLF